MRLLNNITDAADQLMSITLDDGSTALLEFFYRSGIQRWTLDISHPLLNVHGLNLCLSPNLLRQWKNVITFGLAIDSTVGLDPINVEDFLNGRSLAYILSAAEVQQVETEILAPIPLVNP